MDKTVKPITLNLPLEIIEELEHLSKELGKDKDLVLSEALELYIDYHDAKLAEERLNDPNSSRLTLEEFEKELGLD